ncbi:SHOCT domain-containing protein [Candidatus Bathyarchaeota archaeon]|nr:SHOCT domain-containing protein [Candidatus Bathyarchaeota archaeon]
MCFTCGLGWYPLIALSSCNGRYEHYHNESSQSGRALEILRERYAKGEITREQFGNKERNRTLTTFR